jgi:hypothetical protein
LRRIVPLLVVVFAASILAQPGQGAKSRTLTFKLMLIQEQTFRHHKASDGDDHSNDTFSTTLKLIPTVNPASPSLKGTMGFAWGPLKGNCSGIVPRCRGTTTINTFTRLPGGTLTAGGKNVSVANGILVSVKIGTGIFKGATGTIDIAPSSVHEAIFTLRLPA